MKISILHLRFAVIILLIGVISIAITVNTAHADGTVYWDGNGDKNLPCPYGGRWNLTPGDGIDSVIIYVNGSPFTMARSGDDGWFADSNEPLDLGTNAYVGYIGAGGYDYHIELAFCLFGNATPTFAPPTSTSSPTPTNTPVTPTSTQTSTPSFTPTTEPGSPTPTSNPASPTPTNNPTSPTPTNTARPNTPTPTLTQTITPMPTITIIPTQTSTPVPVTATKTPFPPYPAIATDIQSSSYPGENLGKITIGGNTYQLFSGVSASDGSLMLPSNVRGAAFYQNTIWLHRLWRIGYLKINKGDMIAISTAGGEERTYNVTDSTYMAYGIYPESYLTDEPYQYIATCYSSDSGEWIGVELYKLTLVDIHLKRAK
jgi:hypothetical protein